MNKKGFTLVELLIVIGLIGITVGVTGDIILTLIRSYSKTQATTDVERVASFAVGKLEKEFKNATSVTNVTARSITFETKAFDSSPIAVTYNINNTECTGSTCLKRNGVLLTDASEVVADCNGSCFERISTNPQTIKIKIRFTKANTGNSVFSGEVLVNTTVVAKGTYN
ncbi:MAG: hypothetical protein RLY61_885 [Candidatus Parcubacteria bacterium]|jgi:prepilin-type N-terminal cleavage/methylation domain-containing protein